MTFFVQQPPAGDDFLNKPRRGEWDPCKIRRDPEYRLATRNIGICKLEFERTGNPIFPIQAFHFAMEVGLYPPLWALRFVQDRFVAADKVGSLDRAFGFTREGAGKGKWTTPGKAIAYSRRARMLCVDVLRLEAIGMSRSAACNAVASALVTSDGDEILSGAAIHKIVKANVERFSQEEEAIAEGAKSWTNEEKRQLLGKVDPAVLPKKIRSSLKL